MDQLDFKIKEITVTQDYGEFAIEPLLPGYGYTMGNALRRVLYGSIPGAAVTSIKIAGVKHKFSTHPGLKENIIDLILNIKELNLRLPEGQTSGNVRISVKGAKDITAADIESTDNVEVVDKSQYIGSLSGTSAKFDMDLTVESGLGYSLAEERRSSTLGLMPIDAVFSPVTRVTYTVESTRVGQQTNLDKLVMKIWTNGSIEPRAALDQSARILANSFRHMFEPTAVDEIEESGSVASNVPQETLRLTIDELDLPTRIYNSLRNGGIETVEQLLKIPRKELISMRNMGGKSITVIDEKLREKGISLNA